MTTALFQKFVKEFDNQVRTLGLQKALLVLDNAPTHIPNTRACLNVTKTAFLPPNMMSVVEQLH